MKIQCTLTILLLLLGFGCSKHPAPEPVTVTFLDIEYDTPDRLPGLAQDLQAFTQETGIQVKRLPRPAGSLSQLAMWEELLQKGAATPDVYGIDVIWSGILNRYLMDLKPYFSREISSEYPVVVASYTVGDKLVAVPRHAYVGILLYRTDLLPRYGYHRPPKTWAELETMAARIQAGERAKGQKDFWGFVWQGGVSEDLTCAGLEWQTSEGAGRIVEDNQTISVNNPDTVRAWQRAVRWVGTISPPGTVAYEKWDSENLWNTGRAAFQRGWVSDYSLITFYNLPENSTGFGVTTLPAGKAGRTGVLGGNALAISRTAGHPREAMELIHFLLHRDAQLMNATAHLEVPKQRELFELPPILEPYPQLAGAKDHAGTVVARPSIVSGEKYDDVSRAYIRQLHSVLSGEKSSSAAAADLEKELVAMTGFKPGPPSK
jgi:trehalose/maltose transport system substrate-binding protein